MALHWPKKITGIDCKRLFNELIAKIGDFGRFWVEKLRSRVKHSLIKSPNRR